MLRVCAACFSCPCDVIIGRRRERAACLMMSVDVAISDVDSGGVVISYWPRLPLASADVVCAATCVLACLIPFPSFVVISYCLAVRFPAVSPLASFSRVDERGAISCLLHSLEFIFLICCRVHACPMSYSAGGDDG